MSFNFNQSELQTADTAANTLGLITNQTEPTKYQSTLCSTVIDN